MRWDRKKKDGNKKKVIINMLCGGICAFAVLNTIAYFFYSPPTKVINAVRATDFVVESNYSGYIMDEGMAKFTTDSYGYNNSQDSKLEDINILVTGSSHTLGYNVQQSENYSSVLGRLLKEKDSGRLNHVYNMGMWGHTWYTQANNLKDAIELTNPSDYIIMEVHDSLEYSLRPIQLVEDYKYPREGIDQGKIVSTLKSFPAFKLMLHQVGNMMNGSHEYSVEKTDTEAIKEDYTNSLNTVMKSLKSLSADQGCELMIMYHPHLIFDESQKGSARLVSTEYKEIFKQSCKENEIIFWDMSETFLKAYKEEYTVPYGFTNTAVGVGHLNKYGHELIGQDLYELIVQNENKKSLENENKKSQDNENKKRLENENKKKAQNTVVAGGEK